MANLYIYIYLPAKYTLVHTHPYTVIIVTLKYDA